jgi:chromosome segregation protein
MRLNQIKLSGFKSFAEPTTFQLPGQRVGVVGPNGCGKSNIMDAVRWVLGESKASELRGESMQDVIFNGSAQRKPAGRASVELVFSNEDGRAGGSWSQYADIAVKRVLTRDGASSYFINNQPVRRRDVHDVFLGTGLGPRAYAIIGQGTITRIIDSKPEELRLFLEEAAGVSKYKERRRETEFRLRDTRDNLTRVDDILRELGANLEKLERQAEVATRYKGLQEAGTLKLHQLWFLKHRDAATEAQRVHLAMLEATNALEARTAELRHLEAALEGVRQAHYTASDSVHAHQADLAAAAAEVSRLEERIRHVVEGRQRTQTRLAELRAQAAQWAERAEQAEAEQETLAEHIAAAEEQADILAARVEEQADHTPQHEDAVRSAQQRAAQQRSQVGQVQQQLQLLAAESRHLEEQSRSVRSRVDRLHAERRGLALPDAARLDALREQLAQAQALSNEAQARLHTLSEQLPHAEDQRRQAQHAANEATARHTDLHARWEALRALQDKVQRGGKLQPWLEKHGLAGLAAVWQHVHIEPGWETALEAALRERLHALPVSQLERLQGLTLDAPPAKLVFYSVGKHEGKGAFGEAQGRLTWLLERVRVSDPALRTVLADWLAGVAVADSLAQALAQRDRLAPGGCFITREGHSVSAHAIGFYAPDSEQAGLLARQHEIENLARASRAQALLAEEARAALARAEHALADVQQQLAQARREATQTQQTAHHVQVQWLQLSQQAEAARSRQRQLDDELADLSAQLDDVAERRATGEARFEELDLALAEAQERFTTLEDAVIAAERRLSTAREHQRVAERQAQEAQFQARALASRRGELERGIATARQQQRETEQAQQRAQAELAHFDDDAAQAGLQDALALRVAREAALSAARADYDDLSLRLRQGDEQRQTLERAMAPLRDAITRLQLESQAAELGGAQYLEQLNSAGVDLAALAQLIELNGIKLWGLQGEIDRINREMNALGAVNLAALEELSATRERKTFLDAQNADLTQAMQTLEDAIHKIDLETRELLQGTFDQVNDGFGRMFPSLFGGGNAKLVMTGEDILESGVQVMAQPPGKKNATIHLLSGGEKALTAIALVFAIFLLNPAPFCLLDEVDAPLDDANTERYAKLVTQMSEGTQFLFISHNKIAMEMAQQLIGVTMQEQGVSRIVAVDMQAAVGMLTT